MYELNVFAILSLSISLLFFVLGFYVLYINPKNKSNQFFFLMCISLCIWGFGEGMMRATTNSNIALFWSVYVVGLGSLLWAPVFTHFWLQFSDTINKIKYKKTVITVIYAPFVIFGLIRFFNSKLLVTGVVHKYWGYTPVFTNLYELYGLFLFIYSMYVCISAIKKSFSVTKEIKKQYLIISFGALFTILIGTFTQLIAPVVNLQIPELTVISSFIFISAVAYNINNFKLLTVNVETIAKNIVNTINDFIIAIDKNMKISFVNQEVINISGLNEAQLIYQPIKILFNDGFFDLSFEEISQRVPLNNFRTEFISKNKDLIPVTTNISVLRDNLNGIIGIVLVARDIEQLDELARTLQEKNDELEKFNKIATNRELKMIELKKTIELQNEELKKLGKAPLV